jgi:uncharacterized zinc-type alcohol dehydrogenase-like protein
VLVGYLGPLETALNTAPLVLGRKAVVGSVIGGMAADSAKPNIHERFS